MVIYIYIVIGNFPGEVIFAMHIL